MAVPLNRHQAEELIRKVNDELCQQRRKLLALNTPLTILLPQYVRFDLFTAHRSVDDAIRVDGTRPQVLEGLEVVCVMALMGMGKVDNH